MSLFFCRAEQCLTAQNGQYSKSMPCSQEDVPSDKASRSMCRRRYFYEHEEEEEQEQEKNQP